MRIALNLYVALSNMAILTMLSLPIHEHGVSFHFFVASSISFNNVKYDLFLFILMAEFLAPCLNCPLLDSGHCLLGASLGV